MARLLALEWDTREVRVAIARARATDVVLEDAFAIDLAPRSDETGPADVGARIAAALAARDVGKPELLVSVGRASTELRVLTLPPAPPEEWPELVRFQALRQFTAIDEHWPIDFIPLEKGSDGSLNVLAATISPKVLDHIRDTAAPAGLVPRRVILRPFGAASLLRRTASWATSGCRLLIDLLADEADLTVLADGQVLFVRTVRMPHAETPETQAPLLLGEIRRTIGAAQNQLSGRKVQHVTICGDGEEHAALRDRLQEKLELPVELFDPLEHVERGRQLNANRPQHAGRFAPLLGMLLDEAHHDAHALDFLNPRRKPIPTNYRRRFLIGAGAAAGAALLAGLLIVFQLRQLDAEVADLRQQSQQLNPGVEVAREQRAKLERIEQFTQADMTWLNELRQLSLRMPGADEVIVTQLHAQLASGAGRAPTEATIKLQGVASESKSVERLTSQLADPPRQVRSGPMNESGSRQNYPWQFDEQLVIPFAAERQRREAQPAASGQQAPLAEGGEPERAPGRQPS